MRRHHAMPFGAELDGGGRAARFRLWAPGARKVELCIEGREAAPSVPMRAAGEGWFELTTKASAGTRYRYRIDGNLRVPDPASRCNPDDVHGASEVIDPRAYDWRDRAWTGRPWEEAAIYELHVGTFSPEGTFAGAAARLPYLRELGVTAVELMPVADFPGARGWGYDGVLPFAPESRYGRPEALKRLVDAAHGEGLMVLLDVVYNHFGPEGNYLHVYAKRFFTGRHHTPWGAAINYDDAGSRTVRDFFIHNALYWIEEFNLDGLRLDAVHAIADDSRPDILVELAERVRAGPGRGRYVHLVLENDDNAARYLERASGGRARWYDAQWNDDAHHALHVLLTGERDGYYADYAASPVRHLGRCLAEGFGYQGEHSGCRARVRGEPSRALPAEAFVNFLQNHDQVGNRAFGERLTALAPAPALRAAAALLLLAPPPPLIFMGEEYGCEQPFAFFCDFGPELARAVTEGRRNEFARFERFRAPAMREKIPDPNAAATFEAARLDWDRIRSPAHAAWLALYRELLLVRARRIVPLLAALVPGAARHEVLAERALRVEWPRADGTRLALAANLGPEAFGTGAPAPGEIIHALPAAAAAEWKSGNWLAWSVVWSLHAEARA